MNQKLFALGAGMLCVAAATAGPAVKSFPLLKDAPASTEQNQPAKAPLNPNAGKEASIFGYSMQSNKSVDEYVRFFGDSPRQTTTVRNVLEPNNAWEEERGRLVKPAAAVWANGTYYAYRYLAYDLGMFRLDSWVKLDPANGAVTEILHKYGTEDPSYTSWWQNNDYIIPVDALLWNPLEEDNIYVLAKATDGTVTSAIHSVDPESGEFVDEIVQLDEYYLAGAFNYDGLLYALRYDYDPNDPEGVITGTRLDVLDPESDYEVISSQPIRVDGKDFKIYFENNITVNHTTGDIWWSATELLDSNGNSRTVLVKINPDNGSTTNYGGIGWNSHQVGGMHIDYLTADKRTAPAQVSNMSFTIDPAGANKVTINWTNPSTQWNRRSLKELAEVLVYRDNMDGTPIATLDAAGKVGQAMSYVDETATQGIHKYYVVACAKKGEKGVPNSLDAFVGQDAPGPVGNLVAATTDGKVVNLTWTAPSRGDNDGHLENTGISYIITRMPDNKVFDNITETKFTDNTIDELQQFTYYVAAKNSIGTGEAVASNPITAGNDVLVPFSTDFATQMDADRFSSIDRNGDGRYWMYDFNTNLARKTYVLSLSNYDNDDLLVTPPLRLTAGKSYRVKWNISVGGYGSSEKYVKHPMKLVGGTEPTNAALTDVLDDQPDFHTTYIYEATTVTNQFVAPKDGKYYLAYEALTNNESDSWMHIEGFSIEEVSDDDLAATALNCHLALSSVNDNEFTVAVTNNGHNTQNKYKVKVAYLNVYDKPVVVAETSNVPAIAANETKEVKIVSKVESLGIKNMVAIVELEGDGNTANDISPVKECVVDEAPAFNVTVEDPETEESITNIPFNHFTAATASQTIYSPEMTGINKLFNGETEVEVSRMAWEYNSDVDINDNELTIYLGQTDKTGYPNESYQAWAEWVSDLGTEVFNDVVDMPKGHHYVIADFEEPVKVDVNKSLVVTVNKHQTKNSGFLARFRTFDGNWINEKFHSVALAAGEPIDLTNLPGGMKAWPGAPVLHLSLTGGSGIEEVVISGDNTVCYNGATKSLLSNGTLIRSVEVYNLGGMFVKNIKAGSNHVALNLDGGMYLLRAVLENGEAVTLKVSVR